MTRIHILKCWPPGFQALLDGTKRHEVRNDDRDFGVGDFLFLQEYEPVERVTMVSSGSGVRNPMSDTLQWTTREAWYRVTFKTPGGAFGLPVGLCVLTVVPTGPPK